MVPAWNEAPVLDTTIELLMDMDYPLDALRIYIIDDASTDNTPELMQEKMKQAQQELANKEVRGEAGAGLVSVVMTGRHDVRRVQIDDSLLSEDKEVLEDLLAAAVNDAVRKVEENNKGQMGDMLSGMGMPGNFKMPF